jgi:hypothetical protein
MCERLEGGRATYVRFGSVMTSRVDVAIPAAAREGGVEAAAKPEIDSECRGGAPRQGVIA